MYKDKQLYHKPPLNKCRINKVYKMLVTYLWTGCLLKMFTKTISKKNNQSVSITTGF